MAAKNSKFNNNSNLHKVKVSLAREETSGKNFFWMLSNLTKGWYLCCHKSYCTPKCLFSWKHLYFKMKFNNFNYCNKTSKEANQRKSVFGCSHWEPQRYTEFFVKSLKILAKEFIFGNIADYGLQMTEKGTRSQAFVKDFAYRFSC